MAKVTSLKRVSGEGLTKFQPEELRGPPCEDLQEEEVTRNTGTLKKSRARGFRFSSRHYLLLNSFLVDTF